MVWSLGQWNSSPSDSFPGPNQRQKQARVAARDKPTPTPKSAEGLPQCPLAREYTIAPVAIGCKRHRDRRTSLILTKMFEIRNYPALRGFFWCHQRPTQLFTS